jgi:hypothetical protein
MVVMLPSSGLTVNGYSLLISEVESTKIFRNVGYYIPTYTAYRSRKALIFTNIVVGNLKFVVTYLILWTRILAARAHQADRPANPWGWGMGAEVDDVTT